MDVLGKLLTEVDHIERIAATDDWTPERIALALAVAKRVRSTSSLLVRHFASLRDQATAPEGTST